MPVDTTRPIKEMSKAELKELLRGKSLIVSPHAVDHLSEGQRKIFKESELFNMIGRETPRKAYLQKNGRYAAYYRKKDGYRKIIIEIEGERAVVVSFIDTAELPKIRFKG